MSSSSRSTSTRIEDSLELRATPVRGLSPPGVAAGVCVGEAAEDMGGTEATVAAADTGAHWAAVPVGAE